VAAEHRQYDGPLRQKIGGIHHLTVRVFETEGRQRVAHLDCVIQDSGFALRLGRRADDGAGFLGDALCTRGTNLRELLCLTHILPLFPAGIGLNET